MIGNHEVYACAVQEPVVGLSVLREHGMKGRALTQPYQQLFSKDLYLPHYRNIFSTWGTLHSDDDMPGVMGQKAKAEEGKARLLEFLRRIFGLRSNAAKTLVTHACIQRSWILGYQITVQHRDAKSANCRCPATYGKMVGAGGSFMGAPSRGYSRGI
jgi:hypothetical protein